MATYTKLSKISIDMDDNGHLIFLDSDGVSPEFLKLNQEGHLELWPQTTIEVTVDSEGHLQCTSFTDWILWEKYIGNSGGSGGGDDENYEAVQSYIAGLISDPAYHTDAVVEGDVTPLLASRDSPLTCQIQAIPGTEIHIGDLVEVLDEDWLVEEMYTDKLGIIHGVLWLCNRTIRFQNFSPTVHVRKCVIDNGLYRKKTTDPIAYVPHNTYELYLSIDSATEQLFIDKRLAVDLIYDDHNEVIIDAYKIMGIDLISKNHEEGDHLMVILLQNDVYNAEADSIENMLCDIYVEPDSSSEPDPTGSCNIIGKDVIRIGTTRKYSAAFFDEYGEPVSEITPVWTVNVGDNSSIVVTRNGTDNTVSISVPLDEALIGQYVVISLEDSAGDYGTFEKRVQVITVG